MDQIYLGKINKSELIEILDSAPISSNDSVLPFPPSAEIKEVINLILCVYSNPGRNNCELIDLTRNTSASRSILAGIYLGFLDKPLHRKLVSCYTSPLGNEFVEIEDDERAKLFIFQLVSHKIFRNCMEYFIGEGDIPPLELIDHWYGESIANCTKELNTQDRVRAVKNWINEIITFNLKDDDESVPELLKLGRISYNDLSVTDTSVNKTICKNETFPLSVDIDLMCRIISLLSNRFSLNSNEIATLLKTDLTVIQRHIRALNYFKFVSRKPCCKLQNIYLSNKGKEFVIAAPKERSVILVNQLSLHPAIHNSIIIMQNEKRIPTREQIVQQYPTDAPEWFYATPVINYAGSIRQLLLYLYRYVFE